MSATTDPRAAFEAKLVELGKADERIIAVSCDSASGGGLKSFFTTFPERSVEVGISEQNAVSLTAAMSRQGFIPVLVIINPFLTMRAFEQVRDDIGYMDTNVKIVGSGGGLAYSTLGSTHIAIEDIALMRTVPNLTIFAPGDADEVEFALEQSLAIEGPVYIRMPRQKRPFFKPSEQRNLSLTKAEVVQTQDGELDVSIFAYGPSVSEAVKAETILRSNGIKAAVVNMLTVKPLDEEAVLEHSKKSKLIVTLEEHIPTGGLCDAVARVLALNSSGVQFFPIAVPEGAKNTGPYDELVDYYGLSGDKVAKKITELLGK
ncbi:MAG: transketolase family protein [Christensenellales bacterium]|jgi:transketolase